MAIVEWSSEKYAVVFNSFSDNLLGKSFRTRLCLPVPIDVVYTWVNGTDPAMLAELRRTKADLDEISKPNSTDREDKSYKDCRYANCVKLPMAVFPRALPPDIDSKYLETRFPQYRSLVKLEGVNSDDLRANFTLAHFLTEEDVVKATNQSITVRGRNYTAEQAYYTSDVTIPKSKLQHTVVLVSGFKKVYSVEEINKLVPKHVMEHVFDVDMIGRIGIFKTSTSGEADTLLGFGYNFTVDGRYLQFSRANLVYDLVYSGGKELDLSASRFEDNEELRYSLRSLEQYAPWVRHIYIITNGQIPYWLNLDNSRITIITHEEIFVNKTHLPTFSSPAIESHIHRIPGLSDKFLYLNDDVMFGAQVWPDDFYTHSKGQKVYLTWSIPDCAPGCPQTWIKDGYCDKACNVSECSWDAGDCAGGVAAFNAGGNNWDHQHWMQRDETVMCDTGCSNSWIADKYCDAACNVKPCGFDAGDCGVSNYHLMYSMYMSRDIHNYTIPAGVDEAYLNFTSISTLKVTEAAYESHPSLRLAAVSNKYKTVTVILLPKHNQSSFTVNMTFGEGAEKYEFSFKITTDKGVTALSKLFNATISADKVVKESAVTEQAFQFDEIPLAKRFPEASIQGENGSHLKEIASVDDLKMEKLPEAGRIALDDLRKQLLDGEITQKGFDLLRRKLILYYKTGSPEGADDQLLEQQNLNVVVDSRKNALVNSEGKAEAIDHNQERHKYEVERQEVQPQEVVQQKGAKPQRTQPIVAPQDLHQQQAAAQEVAEQEANGLEVAEQEVNEQKADRQEVVRQEVAGQKAAGQEVAGQEVAGQEVAGQEVARQEVAGQEVVRQKAAGQKAAAQEVAGQKADGQEVAGQEVAGQEVAHKELPEEQAEGLKHDGVAESHKSRQLQQYVEQEQEIGFLPWEKMEDFKQDVKTRAAAARMEEYSEEHSRSSRHLLDTFGQSLHHVNDLYNKMFGVKARKVPGHIPHMVDKEVMVDLQSTFREQWEVTSAHKIRSGNDMQYAFSYFYFLIDSKRNNTALDFIEEMDIDNSGVLSDREIRTMATRIFDSPLDLQSLTLLEQHITNCSNHLPVSKQQLEVLKVTSQPERYYDKNLPQVTLPLLKNCGPVVELIKKKVEPKAKYRYEVMGDEDIHFKMIGTNLSTVVGQLDDLRRHPRKFICLNDNIDHSNSEAMQVKALLADFYESMFPIRSQFELPPDYRNRFLHSKELREWQKTRDYMKLVIEALLVVLVVYTIYSFYEDQIKLRIQRRRRPKGGENV